MNQEAQEREGKNIFSDMGVTGGEKKKKDGDDGSGDDEDGGGDFLTGLSLMIPVKPMLAKYVSNITSCAKKMC